jgi:Phospholipase_D-nuclease N-terminal
LPARGLAARYASRQTAACPQRDGENSVKIEVGGLLGLLILIADVWAIVNIFQSPASTGAKVLWTVLVLVLPIFGLIIWFFAGPRTGKA